MTTIIVPEEPEAPVVVTVTGSVQVTSVTGGIRGEKGDKGDKGDPGTPGAPGQDGLNGQDGLDGQDGQGVPTGGTTGQALVKLSGANYDTGWQTISAGGGGTWGSITGTLSAQTDLQTALDGKATSAQGALADSALQPGDTIPWADVSGKPSTFTPSAHSHVIADVTGLQTALDGKQAAGSYAAAVHTHTAAQVSGLATVATTGAYGDLTGIPSTFTPAAHNQAWSTITSTPTTLSGYGITDAAPSSHVGAGGAAHAAATTSVAGFMAAADKTKLDGIAAGAEVNQNAFTTIAVSGQSNVVADAKTDTLTLVAGSNVTITTDAGTDTITIAATGGGGGATNLAYDAATRVISSDTGTDATLPIFTTSQAGLVPASGGGTTNFLRADGTFAAPPGGGGLSALGLHDWWEEVRFATTDVAQGPFLGAAIASGTNNAAIPSSAVFGYNPHGVLLRSSTTANSGYRYQTISQVSDYFGVTSRKFRAQITHMGAANCMVRCGFMDVTTTADPTDAVIMEITASGSNLVLTPKRFANGVWGSDTGASMAPDGPFTIEIDVAADASSVRFRAWRGAVATTVLDRTYTATIPSGSARLLGAGMQAYFVGTPSAATDICVLHSMGIGTIDGFTRARG